MKFQHCPGFWYVNPKQEIQESKQKHSKAYDGLRFDFDLPKFTGIEKSFLGPPISSNTSYEWYLPPPKLSYIRYLSKVIFGTIYKFFFLQGQI